GGRWRSSPPRGTRSRKAGNKARTRPRNSSGVMPPPSRSGCYDATRQEGGRAMPHSGRIGFGAMESVTFGRPAAEVVAEEARRREAERVFLMVSGTLNRETDEVAKLRRALGNRFAGLFDHMPPHTRRHAVVEAAAMAREAGADLIVTLGGGSVTDGAKAFRLCIANDIVSADAIEALCQAAGPE